MAGYFEFSNSKTTDATYISAMDSQSQATSKQMLRETWTIAHAGHGDSELNSNETPAAGKPAGKNGTAPIEKPAGKTDTPDSGADKPVADKVTDTTLPEKINIHKLPNGDGQYVTTLSQLKPGKVLVSDKTVQQMRGDLGGAEKPGPQINSDGTYDATKRLVAPGNVLHQHKYNEKVDVANDTRTIFTNTLPEVGTGKFPLAPNPYDRNPNTIKANDVSLTVPLNPKAAEQPSPLGSGAVAIAKDGTLLYSPLDGKGRDANKWEITDSKEKHVDPASLLHGHQIAPYLYEKQDKTAASPVLARALDGYPIVAAFKANGELYTTKELDKFHGREVDVKQDDGTVKKQWAYCVSLDYPYTMGAFKGTPSTVENLRKPTPPEGRPPGRDGAQPPLPNDRKTGDGTQQIPEAKPIIGKPGTENKNILPSVEITDDQNSKKSGGHKTAKLETTLYDVAKKSLAEINQNSASVSSDSVYRELNRIMVLNGYQPANLEGKKNISDHNLPRSWNNVSRHQEFKIFENKDVSNKQKPLADSTDKGQDRLDEPNSSVA